MNVLFLSPFFPPNAHLYCSALSKRGITVLAIGDAPPEQQPPELEGVLTEYVFEPQMHDYLALEAAVRGLVSRHGKLDRLDSNGEHWLAAEGRLRDDFGVPGLTSEQVGTLRSKFAMSEVFGKAGVPYPATARSAPTQAVRAFRERHGLPLVFKPDVGSGAVDTFVVSDAAELEAALARGLTGHVVQPFVSGEIVTFDGLTDRNGQIVFCTSHVYDAGIMQVRQSQRDGHYYSLRSIPAELERVGRRSVAAFDIRERFFHLEFFAQADGSYVGLEMNVRPPGGYSTDMMSAACDFDVYDLWAGALSGELPANFAYTRLYHTAHAGRRRAHAYRLSSDQLERELGEVLFAVKAVPDAFAVTMGNLAYLLRSPDLATLQRAIALVQAPL